MSQIKIGKRLKELREKKEISQAELGKQIGLSQKNISAYERDMSSPSVDMLVKITKYFNVSVDYLIFGSDLVEKYNKEMNDYGFFKYLRVIDKLDKGRRKAVEIILKDMIYANKDTNQEVKNILKKEKF